MENSLPRMKRTLHVLPTPLSSGLALLNDAHREQRALMLAALMKLDSNEPLETVGAQLCQSERTIASIIEVDHVASDLIEHARRVGEYYTLKVEAALATFVRERSDRLLSAYVALETAISNLGDVRHPENDIATPFDKLSVLFREAFDACDFLLEDVPVEATGQWNRVLAMRSPKFARLIGPTVPEELKAAIATDLTTRVSPDSRSYMWKLCDNMLEHHSMRALVHVVRLRSYYHHVVAANKLRERRDASEVDVDKIAFGAHLFTHANCLLRENERTRILAVLPFVDGDTPQQVFLAFARAYVRPGQGLQQVAQRIDDMFTAMQPMPVQMAGDVPDDYVILAMVTLFLGVVRAISREHWAVRVMPSSPDAGQFFRQINALRMAPSMAPLMLRALVALLVSARVRRILGRAAQRSQFVQLFADDLRACHVEASGFLSSGHWTFCEKVAPASV